MSTRRAVRLSVTMSGGTTLTIKPRPTPRRLWKRLPWLRGLRTFDKFFPAGEKPQIVTAYDHAGRMLARRRSDHGAFSQQRLAPADSP